MTYHSFLKLELLPLVDSLTCLFILMNNVNLLVPICTMKCLNLKRKDKRNAVNKKQVVIMYITFKQEVRIIISRYLRMSIEIKPLEF